MSKNVVNCPSCGGPNDNPDNKDQTSCIYCAQEIITQEVKDGTSAIKPKNEKLYNFLQMADSALEGEEDEEALNYYNKVLEEDTSYSAAWFGKGSALINTSKIGDIKMSGTIASFKNAVKYSKNKDDMKKAVANRLAELCPGFFNSIANHYMEFEETDNATADFVTRYIQIESGLAYALECDPESEKIADAFISMRRTCFLAKPENAWHNEPSEELVKKGEWGNFVVGYHPISQLPYNFSRKYIDLKKKLNPDWEPGSDLFPKKSGSCFIATATMGDYNHPTVMSLRGFRDNYLLHQDWGRAFIQFYYKWGPYPANVINKSSVLKKLSYYTLVKPLSLIASKLK